MNYYERHIGDYLKDTAHLSLLEHGIYGRLLDIYYTREAAIPEAQVMRLVGARSPEEFSAVRDVLSEFFTRDGDVWRHSRCDKELAKYQDKQRKAKASADARWGKDKSHTERNANALRTHCEGNAPSNQTPVTSNTPLPPQGAQAEPAGFVRFWAAWPKSARKGGKAKCLQLWWRSKLEPVAEQIVSHVERMAGEPDWTKEAGAYIPAPLVYLNQRRWDGADPGGTQPILDRWEGAL